MLAPHPSRGEPEAFWLIGGRLVDFGALGDAGAEGAVEGLVARTEAALRREGRVGEVGAHVPPDEVDEMRILGTWLASHPETPQLVLRPAPDEAALGDLLARARRSGGEGELDDDGVDLVGADHHV